MTSAALLALVGFAVALSGSAVGAPARVGRGPRWTNEPLPGGVGVLGSVTCVAKHCVAVGENTSGVGL